MNQLKERPIAFLGEKYVSFPLPHQVKITNHLKKNGHRQISLKTQIKEKPMNFNEAVEAARTGIKVRRAGWEKDMWMEWHRQEFSKGFLVHSHPYWEHQPCATEKGCFVYVTENDDALAEDWERIAV